MSVNDDPHESLLQNEEGQGLTRRKNVSRQKGTVATEDASGHELPIYQGMDDGDESKYGRRSHSRLRPEPGGLESKLPPPPESLDFDMWESRVNLMYNIELLSRGSMNSILKVSTYSHANTDHR
jgi:hypothetical protein